MHANPELEGVATRIADGSPIDWPNLERGTDNAEQRALLLHLRSIDGLSRALGSLDQPDTDLRTMIGHVSRSIRTFPRREGPRRWGPLDVHELIGEGAFGLVYRARDRNLEKDVALKLLNSDHRASEDSILREGRLMARVRHPNVVAVYGADRHDSTTGLWMELIDGQPFDEFIEDHGRLGDREAVLVGTDLCGALAAIHGAGLVHRDVKARNVMREEGGRTVLMDFGAGITSQDAPRGTISGTPLYIAPEVLEGRPPGPRSDLYSLGVLLYNLVTGEYPYAAGSLNELKRLQRGAKIRLLRDRRPDLSDAFIEVVERALSVDPLRRFATAGEMQRALALALGLRTEAPAHPPGTGSRLRRRVVVAAALVCVAGLIATLYAWHSATGFDASLLDVEASLVRRVERSDAYETIDPGTPIHAGDELRLRFGSPLPLHLYVVSEDGKDGGYALFPSEAIERHNPLPAHRTVDIPEAVWWTASASSGSDRMWIVASPVPLEEYERILARLDQLPRVQPSSSDGSEPPVTLRGLTGVTAPEPWTRQRALARLESLARELDRSGRAWVRFIDLEYASD